jgi:hypothetical protein
MSKTTETFVKLTATAASAIVKQGRAGFASMGNTGAFLIDMATAAKHDSKGKPIDKEQINDLVKRITDDEFAQSRLRNVLRACNTLPEASRVWEKKHGTLAYQAVANLASALLKSNGNVAKAVAAAGSKKSSRGKTKPSREGSVKSAAIHIKSMLSLKLMPKEFYRDLRVLAANHDINV